MAIEFIGDAVQYFGFNKQVLVQIDKKGNSCSCELSYVSCALSISNNFVRYILSSWCLI
jgi:hypothetical protein